MRESTRVHAPGGNRVTRSSLAAFARTERFRWILVAAFMVMLALVRAGSPDDRDPYWGARAGWENLTGTPLARPDTWSWAADGVWYPNSPLWGMLLGGLWQALGYWGLFLTGFVSLLVYFWLAWKVAILLGARPLPGLLGMAVPLALAFPMLSMRATLAIHSLIFVSVLFAHWWGRRVGGVSVALNAAVVGGMGALLSVLGNWIHLSFLLLSALVALMWVVTWWLLPGVALSRRSAISIAGTGGLLAGAVLSPFGIALTMERARAVQEACRGLILEWSSVVQVGLPQWYVAGFLAVVVAGWSMAWLLTVWRRSSADPRLRVGLPLLILGGPTAVAGFAMIRFLGLSLLTMTPLAAVMVTVLADVVHTRTRSATTGFWARPRAAEYSSGTYWTVIFTAVGVILSPGALLFGAKGARPPELSVIRQLPPNCRAITDVGTAGPLILERPDVTVLIDGRADFYGRDHLVEVFRVFAGVDPIPKNATCAVFPVPSRRTLVTRAQAALDADPAWEQIAEADGYLLWVRR